MDIFIVEDDKKLLGSLTILLSGEPKIKVSGAFGTGEEALDALKTRRPDVMLIDLGLPGISGVDLIGMAKAQYPDVECMALTVFDDKNTIFSAIRAGATGYILKGATPRQLIEALHTIHDGGAPMSPKIARAVVFQFQSATVQSANSLTNREIEVLQLLGKGQTYQQVAGQLNISFHTVHSHIKQIYEKLQAKGRQDALVKARKKGFMV